MSLIGRRKAKYESCPRLLLEQAVALRHTARYAEFLRLFEPSHHDHLNEPNKTQHMYWLSALLQFSCRSKMHYVSPKLTCTTSTPSQ